MIQIFGLKNTGENLVMELLVGYGCGSLEIFGETYFFYFSLSEDLIN